MKVVIIEDEKPAVEKLQLLLKEYDSNIEIIAILSSVEASLNWIKANTTNVDLYFMDIHLSDGKSFDIFEQIEINKPVIFITAFNEYALKAFKVNSIDYLLKPFSYDDLSKSLEKLKTIGNNLPENLNTIDYRNLNNAINLLSSKYKKRFMVKVGMHILSVKSENIAIFYAEGRTVYILSRKEHKYIVDYTLDELVKNLDPKMFFRVNRSAIVNINDIKEVLIYSNSRLLIKLNQKFDRDIVVSRERVSRLKTWLEGF